MAKFDAASAVEALEFDFTPYRPAVPDDPADPDYERLKALADAQWVGVIPEPTDEAVEQLFRVALPGLRMVGDDAFAAYLAEQRAARREWARDNMPGATTDEEIDALDVPQEMIDRERARLAEIDHETRLEGRRRLLDALAEFCQGVPSRDVLAELPWRAIQMFSGWLTGQFSPETVAAAMNA